MVVVSHSYDMRLFHLQPSTALPPVRKCWNPVPIAAPVSSPQTYFTVIGTAKKAGFRAILRVTLGDLNPERT
jgi:hypothetical protein